MDTETLDTATASLRWQCRRGMLELDLLLGTFLDKGYAVLTRQAQEDFKRLLALPDPTLYAWLIGQTLPERGPFGDLVAAIRHVLSDA
jgi:antitoxin CptB